MKYIFEVRIKPGATVEEYATAWEKGSTIIQRLPGARGTRLHRKIGDPNTLLAIAEWDSKESRDSAMESIRNDEAMRHIADKHEEFAEFIKIGEYDDPAWQVFPPNSR